MMSKQQSRATEYEFRIADALDTRWQAWFEGLTISRAADGGTSLRGPVTDQAALYGVLRKINNLGLTLISVNRQSAQESGRRDT